jgi:hypothetical protein
MLADARFLARFVLAGSLFLIGCGSDDLDAQPNPPGKPEPASEKKVENPLARKTGNPLSRKAEKADPWLGSFHGEELDVTVRVGARGAYRDELRMGNQTYPFQGAMQGKELRGKFQAGAGEYEFVARLSGDALSLETDATKYSMTREKKTAAPTARTAEVVGSKDETARVQTSGQGKPARNKPAPPLVKMKSFDHKIGFTFQHPATWKLTSVENGLALIPSDVKKDAQGQPLELFLVSGDSAEGVTSAADPNVAAYFDRQVPQWYPGLRRSGKTESLECLIGNGTIYTYEGKVTGGVEIRVMIYATIYKDTGIFLAHAAEKDLFAARRAISRQMFSSFGWKKGRVDPKLAGHWYRNETSSSGYDPIGGSVGASTKTQYLFSEDGTVSYTSGTQFFGTVTGAGGSVTIDDPGGRANISSGTWSVSGDRLNMLWSGGGAETYEYLVFPHENSRALKLLVPGEKKPLYFHPR